MPRYTMRRTWPDDHDRPNDYVFEVDGKDAGRCYFMRAAGGTDVWLWTVYGTNVAMTQSGHRQALMSR